MIKFPELCDQQEENGADLGDNYRNDRGCREFLDSIAGATRAEISDEINDTQYFCVIVDGGKRLLCHLQKDIAYNEIKNT